MQSAKLSISSINLESVPLNSDKEYFLDPDKIMLYSIYLPDFMPLKSELNQFLNSSEKERAERFHKEIDKNRFIVYRSILKFILSTYTNLGVENIYFTLTNNKKPYLASHPELHFNISHSEDFAVIAIANKEVGIDIEYLSADFNFNNLFSDIFKEDEITIIKNAADKKQAFYTLWTRKEAFVKAIGKGIDEDFRSIPSLNGEHNIENIMLKNNKNWQLHSFIINDNYLGAIAFESSFKNSNLVLFSVPNTMKKLQQMVRF